MLKRRMLKILTGAGSIFRVVNIRTRLVVSFLLISLIPLAATGYISYKRSSGAIENKIRSYSSEVVKQLGKNFKTELTKADNVSTDIAFTTAVQNGLKDITGALSGRW